MFNFGPTFIWTMLNLIVMYVVLKKLLFKPIMKIMEDRENSIKKQIDDAEQLQNDAKVYKTRYKEQLDNAQKDGESIIKEAKEAAQKECEHMIEETRREAEKIIMKARGEIEEERDKMVQELRKQVVDLSILIASRVMEVNLNNETNKQVVRNFLDKEGVL
ncbi:MAG: F0F1 ATP synthase subunit B [Clostridiales bacterium]|nr:F0F1 ATP synthase subunit B [Clostridiales bacterium]